MFTRPGSRPVARTTLTEVVDDVRAAGAAACESLASARVMGGYARVSARAREPDARTFAVDDGVGDEVGAEGVVPAGVVDVGGDVAIDQRGGGREQVEEAGDLEEVEVIGLVVEPDALAVGEWGLHTAGEVAQQVGAEQGRADDPAAVGGALVELAAGRELVECKGREIEDPLAGEGLTEGDLGGRRCRR